MSSQTSPHSSSPSRLKDHVPLAVLVFVCFGFLFTSFLCFWAMPLSHGWYYGAMALGGIAFFLCFIGTYLDVFETKKNTPWVLLAILTIFFYLLI